MSEAVAPVAPTPANGAPPEAPQKPAEVAKPVNVEVAEEYDIEGEKVMLTRTQARTRLQKAGALDKRIQQTTESQKKLDALLKAFEEDPEATLAKLGKDPQKLIAEHLARKAKTELMTPEQREAQKLQQERDEYKAKVEAIESEKKAAAQAQIDQRNFTALEQQLIAAADKAGLDQSPEVLEWMADIAIEAVELGYSITPEQVAQEVILRQTQTIEQRDKKLLAKLEGKKLLGYLGETTLARVKAALAEADAESLKKIPPPQKPKVTQVRAHTRTEKGFLSETEFDKKFAWKK